jgi:hypothetical protein
MRPPQPPFGMDREITQVRTQEPYASGPHYFQEDHSITDPFGRPGCYKHSKRPCGNCVWKQDCENAEGRS